MPTAVGNEMKSYNENMKSSKNKKFIALILVAILASSVFALSACNRSSIVQRGILYDDEEQIIDATGLSDAICEIIFALYDQRDIHINRNYPPDNVKGYIAVAEKADEIIKKSGITEEQYTYLRDELNANRDEYVWLISSYRDNQPLDDRFDETEVRGDLLSYVLNFCSVLGKNKFSEFVYDLYDFRLNYMRDYYADAVKISATWLALYDAAERDLKRFESIDIDEFEKLLCASLLIMDTFSVKIDSKGFELSDSEMAELFHIPDFNINLDHNQWSFILEKFGDLIPGYYNAMFKIAEDSQKVPQGGLAALSLRMEYVVRLLKNIQSMIDVEMIGKIRNGEYSELVVEIVQKATDEDWDLLENVLNMKIYNPITEDAYCKKARELTNSSDKLHEGSISFATYMENVMSFDDYNAKLNDTKVSSTEKETLKNKVANHTLLLTYTSEQAKAALKNTTPENISFVAEGVLAGLSPAFTYGLHNKLRGVVLPSES